MQSGMGGHGGKVSAGYCWSMRGSHPTVGIRYMGYHRVWAEGRKSHNRGEHKQKARRKRISLTPVHHPAGMQVLHPTGSAQPDGEQLLRQLHVPAAAVRRCRVQHVVEGAPGAEPAAVSARGVSAEQAASMNADS